MPSRFGRARRTVAAGLLSVLVVGAGAFVPTEVAGAISSGDQIPGSALPIGTYTAGTPFSSGQTVEVKVPANSVFPQGQNIVILECAAPGGVLPTEVDQCQPNTVSDSTILPASDGSFNFTDYTIYALPDALLGEPSNVTPVCNLTNECVLWIGNDYNDIAGSPHVFSQGFFVNPTPGDTGANPGDGTPEAPAAIGLPLAATAAVGGVLFFRRRKAKGSDAA